MTSYNQLNKNLKWNFKRHTNNENVINDTDKSVTMDDDVTGTHNDARDSNNAPTRITM